MAKAFSDRFYHSKQWKRARRLALRRDYYTCADCDGRANEVHHIIELTPENINDINITLNLNNLMSLCHDCHKKRTKKCNDVADGYMFDDNGHVIPDIPPGVAR